MKKFQLYFNISVLLTELMICKNIHIIIYREDWDVFYLWLVNG